MGKSKSRQKKPPDNTVIVEHRGENQQTYDGALG